MPQKTYCQKLPESLIEEMKQAAQAEKITTSAWVRKTLYKAIHNFQNLKNYHEKL